MDITQQLYALITRFEDEQFWKTMSENDIIKISNFGEDIYCSMIGKHSPYNGIEIFIGLDGYHAMIERLQSIYYPDYIYRYRQNSILIYIEDKINSNKELKMIQYEKGNHPKLVDEKQHFKIYEYLVALYDAIKIMQSQNIFGNFHEDQFISYYFNSKQFNYEIKWDKWDYQYYYTKALPLQTQIDVTSDLEVEIDLIYIQQDTLVWGLFVLDANTGKVLFQNILPKQDYTLLQKRMNQIFQIFGKFKKVYVRSMEQMQLLKNYQLNIEIKSNLPHLDRLVEKEKEDE